MTFTKEVYLEFKVQYMESVRGKKETFFFKGHEFLTSYAKYVLEYISPKFEKSI